MSKTLVVVLLLFTGGCATMVLDENNKCSYWQYPDGTRAECPHRDPSEKFRGGKL